MGLKNVKLNEREYRNYILEHYTFLKRPVIVYGQEIFIKCSKTIERVKIANLLKKSRYLALFALVLVQLFYGVTFTFANDVIDGGHIMPFDLLF